MKVEVRISQYSHYFAAGASMEIPNCLHEAFAPVEVRADAFDRVFLGGISERQMQKVMVVREDAAKIIAEALTEMLVAEMSKRDTRNGYTKEDEEAMLRARETSNE